MNPTASRKQYLVFLPHTGGGTIAGPRLRQTSDEQKISTSARKVVTLSPDELEELKSTTPGVQVFENYPFKAPTPEEMGWKDVPESPLRPLTGESVQIHGAAALHAEGIQGNSSKLAPIVVTVDTGVAAHKDLQTAERGMAFWDAIDQREEGWNDLARHGTAVTGIMVANGAVKGMAPQARFIGIKCLDDEGNGTSAGILNALEKAGEYYDRLCKPTGRPMVLNFSLGSRDTPPPTNRDPLHHELPKLLDPRPGMVAIFAAGNSGPGANTIRSPGNFKHERAIAAAAVNTKDTLPLTDDVVADFSSRGGDDLTRAQDALRQGVMADGVQVLSTVNEDKYARIDGTSFSAPHVTGAAALLYDLAGKLHEEGRLKVKPTEINALALLRDAAVDNPRTSPDSEGLGTLDVARAAKLLRERFEKPAA